MVLGTIVRPHGLKGEVKINLSCSGLDRLTACKNLRLVKNGKELKPVTVIRGFVHNDGDAVVRFKEVVGTEEAETLRGVLVAVRSADREELPEDNFYIDDLMGVKVETVQGKFVGKVEEVMSGVAKRGLGGEGRRQRNLDPGFEVVHPNDRLEGPENSGGSAGRDR